MVDAHGQLDRSSPTRTKAGRRRCSASPTSSGSGRRSPSARASTSPTRSPPGASTWRASSAARRELNDLRFDALHYRGPGTDFTVGLLGNARWMSALFRTAAGHRVRAEHADRGDLHDARLPPRRGHRSASSRPLALLGDVVEGLQLTVRRTAGSCRSMPTRAPTSCAGSSRATSGAAYFGELALVDGTSRVGQTGITFFDTLFDENATCHIAYGFGIPEVFDGEPGEGMNVVDGAHGLHGRRAGARGRRRDAGRQARPDPARGRVAAAGVTAPRRRLDALRRARRPRSARTCSRASSSTWSPASSTRRSPAR